MIEDTSCKAGMEANIESIPSQQLSISGTLTLTTTNVIMANWSNECGKVWSREQFECYHQARLDRISSRQLRSSVENKLNCELW
ncbi:hypothetical protein KIN20_001300 [Parelaphostrongylus tenuis]|uniref:Uncharacterized protein n=1 Tax=Parelaphostrongylus tenuis TaxID=148309 RepID=A0AAD5MER3_PARTN|nr:hypothetical protein KIN20_001300 [Parelaphostrongylus tenuis]